LTSYPLLARDRDALIERDWHLVIFDEAQFLKNAKTQTHAAAAALRARHRLALTGTPIENNLGELWAHFNLLLPGFLGDAAQFARAWRTPIEKRGDQDRLTRLTRRVRPFILRRTRAEVLDDLPEKTEIVRHVELEGAQRDLYESLRIALDGKLRRAIAAKGIAGSQIMILDALLKLRQACCDPRLVKAEAAKAAHDASAKLDALREMLIELRAEGKRALLFSQFTSMLDLIEPELPALGVRHVRLTGDTKDREAPVKTFQAGEADLFLISLRAGGTGLNLTAADTVIHYDPWWNPAVEAQATARAHRIGQAKEVFVFKLIARGTVEERILQLLARKQALANALLAEGQVRGALITEDDVCELLRPIDSDF
jgi:SNF2 family DNA or RNA helicase